MLFLLLPWLSPAHAAQDLCEILNLSNCASVSRQSRRASAQTVPSTGAATAFNPANVSHDRGLGVEVIYPPGGSPSWGVATGTGKVGAALVGSQTENGFFGNRAVEPVPTYIERMEDEEQYVSKKLGVATGAGLWKGRTFGLDVGVMGRHNRETGKWHAGYGVSARLGPTSFGFSSYRDDMRLKFGTLRNPSTGDSYASEWEGERVYEETYQVQTLFAGVRLGKLFLDVGQFQAHYKFYDDEVTVRLFAAAYIHGKWLLNAAVRREDSPQFKYEGGESRDEELRTAHYAGLQYSLGKRLVVGIHHNYYLLKELSFSGTLFF